MNKPPADIRATLNTCLIEAGQAKAIAASLLALAEGICSRIDAAQTEDMQRALATPAFAKRPGNDHRRDNRPGRLRKIEHETELQAFIKARIASMTFLEIEADVTAHFPADRQVKKSAIHQWWKRGLNR